MRKVILAISILFLAIFMAGADGTSFSAGLGFDFFNYRQGDNYLSTSVSLRQRIGGDVELNLGFEFGLTTEPQFFIPISAGLNFLFPVQDRFGFLIGTGLPPVFLWDEASGSPESSSLRFFIGPYLKGGFQIKTHHYMKIFLELQQDLLIGAPDWINTCTRIHGGVIFSLP